MRRIRVLVLLVVALLPAGCGAGDRAEEVAFSDLIAKPEKYQGKEVCTTGVYLRGFEGNSLGATTYTRDGLLYLTEPAIWLEGADIRSLEDCTRTDTIPPFDFCQAVVCGLFETGGGFGHLGAYAHQLRGKEAHRQPTAPPSHVEAATPPSTSATALPSEVASPRAEPPLATLEIEGQVQVSGIGSYYWSEGTEETAHCVDTFSVVTPQLPLPVPPDCTARFQLASEEAPAELHLQVMRVSAQDELPPLNGGWRAWPLGSGQHDALTLLPGPEAELSLSPGSYVLELWAAWPGRGEVSYGFLLDVQASPAPPATASAPGDFGCLVYYQQEHDAALWVLKGGEPPRWLAAADRGWITPDGGSVVYINSFPEALWIAGTDGSAPECLYTAPIAQPYIVDPVLAPDGTMVVFRLLCPSCDEAQNPRDLWGVDIPAGSARQLSPRADLMASFSPDGRWLALTSVFVGYPEDGVVGVIDREGHGEVALIRDVMPQRIAWADDSSGFVAAVARAENLELWWVPIAGSVQELGRLAQAYYPAWQPGLGRLVFQSSSEDGLPSLYLANRDGSDAMPIPGSVGVVVVESYGRAALDRWSPDGRWLLANTIYEGKPYLIDIQEPAVYPLDAQVTFGWLDADGYLAGYTPGDVPGQSGGMWSAEVELYRCKPLGACRWLAKLPRDIGVSYAERCP